MSNARRALVSVSDKSGIVEGARSLSAAGFSRRSTSSRGVARGAEGTVGTGARSFLTRSRLQKNTMMAAAPVTLPVCGNALSCRSIARMDS